MLEAAMFKYFVRHSNDSVSVHTLRSTTSFAIHSHGIRWYSRISPYYKIQITLQHDPTPARVGLDALRTTLTPTRVHLTRLGQRGRHPHRPRLSQWNFVTACFSPRPLPLLLHSPWWLNVLLSSLVLRLSLCLPKKLLEYTYTNKVSEFDPFVLLLKLAE